MSPQALTGGLLGPSVPWPALLAEALTLVSWWKAIILLLPLIGWARLVTSVFDKHAERFFLGREKWAMIHTAAGFLAVAFGFGMPFPAWWGFLVGLAAMLVVLAADIIAFASITNADEKVPDQHKLKLDFSQWAESRAEAKQAKLASTVILQIQGPDKLDIQPPAKDTPEYEVRSEAEAIYIKGQTSRASRVDIVPGRQEGTYAVTMLVDGVRQPGEALPTQKAGPIIDFWKACAGLDTNDRRRRLSGTCRVASGEARADVTVVTSGSAQGVRLALVFNQADAVDKPADQLGLLPAQLETLQGLVKQEGGVVLLAASPLQGRTTTLYSMIRMHDVYTSNVQTVEIEPQAALEGIKQIRFDATAEGAEFSTTLRSILRRDPDIVGVADLPDVETAKEIARADLARSRVYVSLKADAALSAIQLWVKAVGDPKEASESLRGVVAQKLARTLCDNCKVAYQPPPDLLRKVGLPADKVKQLYKKGGQVLIKNKPEVCPICQGVGYVGQTGLFEVVPIGPDERALIAEQNWSQLRAEIRKNQHPTIQQVALRKAVEGKTSIEEISRVTAPQQSGDRKGKAA